MSATTEEDRFSAAVLGVTMARNMYPAKTPMSRDEVISFLKRGDIDPTEERIARVMSIPVSDPHENTDHFYAR